MSRPYRGKKVIHKRDGSVTIVTRLGPKRKTGGGGGGCFPSSTKVLTPSGWCPIGKLHPNDSIISFDFKTGSVATRIVTHRIDYGTRKIWALTFEQDHLVLEVTATHSFLCKHGWKRASEVEPGDVLLCTTSAGLIERTVSRIGATQALAEVHNIYTSIDHNFIVQGGFIAHNFSYLRAIRTWLHKHAVDTRQCAPLPALRC